jgi:hypothetical protein
MPFTTPSPVRLLSDKSESLWGDTEPVFIQSSPQREGQGRGLGPARRVLRRRNDVFVSLRTPESPIVVYLADKKRRKLGQAITKTGNRRTSDFVELPSRFPNTSNLNQNQTVTMTDWDITIVPIIDPLDLTVLSGHSGSTRSESPAPGPGQTVTKGIICHERVEYFILTYF